MNKPRLTPISYVVLGMIERMGPSTPYAVETAVERSVAFWRKFSHSQLYCEPERLTSLGLLTAERELKGRRRNIYQLTPSGRSALHAWLSAPVDEVFEVRDDAVLRLLFSDGLDPERLVAAASRKVDLYEARLQIFSDIHHDERARHADSRCMAPLQLSIRLARTMRDFWADIADTPPPPSPADTDLPDTSAARR
jgi:PadR family transcriptional regulator, regulatory protein AphA